MAALLDNTVLDAALNAIKNGANQLRICSTGVTNFATSTTNTLASVTVTSTDFTGPANGSPDGRQITVAAKSGVSVSTSGKAVSYVLVNTTSSTLLAMTDVNASSPDLTQNSTVDIPTVTFSIAQPTVV